MKILTISRQCEDFATFKFGSPMCLWVNIANFKGVKFNKICSGGLTGNCFKIPNASYTNTLCFQYHQATTNEKILWRIWHELR